MNEVAAIHRDIRIVFYSVAATGLYCAVMFLLINIQLRKITTRLDLVLRKLNNSQPDDEGGY